MTPVVNDQFKYIMLYAAKVGCTSMRTLYISIHEQEFSDTQRASLDGYHNLNEICPYDLDADYSDYFTFILTRNPYSRVVSAFIDQYAFAKNSGVQTMLAKHPPTAGEPETFIDFLQYLKSVPDGDRDSHFQTQSHCDFAGWLVTKQNLLFKLFGFKRKGVFGVDYDGDISGFNQHMHKVYSKIFAEQPEMLNFARERIDAVQKLNSSFYGERDFADAAMLSVDEINQLVFAPKPQDFFNSPVAIDLVNEIYADDFKYFGYKFGDIPTKGASSEINLVPDDFDWQMYLQLNPDLPSDKINNERTVIRHYLEFGRFEEIPRAYKLEAPEGFDWRRYLSLHSDLASAGIDNEPDAIGHYLSFGIREHREF